MIFRTKNTKVVHVCIVKLPTEAVTAEEPAGIVYCPPEAPYKSKYRSTAGQLSVEILYAQIFVRL